MDLHNKITKDSSAELLRGTEKHLGYPREQKQTNKQKGRIKKKKATYFLIKYMQKMLPRAEWRAVYVAFWLFLK